MNEDLINRREWCKAKSSNKAVFRIPASLESIVRYLEKRKELFRVVQVSVVVKGMVEELKLEDCGRKNVKEGIGNECGARTSSVNTTKKTIECFQLHQRRGSSQR